MTQNWQEIWEARRLDPSRGSVLAQLMAADGLDTGFGSVSEDSWRSFAKRVASELSLQPGESVFEVGCGAGAFLYDFWQRGVAVGGIDRSSSLIGFARDAMPCGAFSVADATALDVTGRHDIVLACGVFLYFADLPYAADVIGRMCAKARRAIAVLDTPDAEKRDAAMGLRRGTMGAAEYEARYAGLDHLYYAKDWVRDALVAGGMSGVRIEDQAIPGYANAAYRFNAYGFRK